MLVEIVTAPRFPGLRDNRGLDLIVARIQHPMRNVASMPAETFRFLPRCAVPTRTGCPAE